MVPMSSLKRSTLLVAPALAVLMLSGCGSHKYYTDRNYEYYDSKLTKPLDLPASRNQSDYIDAMPIPNADSQFVRPDGKFKVPRPASSAALQRKQAPVEVRESNGQRWLVVDGTPSSVWPRLTSFAGQQGGGVTETLPAQGTIKTNRFTLAVRQGVRMNSTEVYCLSGNTTDQNCIAALQNSLSTSSEGASASMATGSLDQQGGKVRLDGYDNNWRLLMGMDYPHAWSELSYQLGQSFNTDDRRILDQHQESGELLIRFHANSASSGGWFSWFHRGATKNYILHLNRVDPQQVSVTVTDEQGNATNEAVSREILSAVGDALN